METSTSPSDELEKAGRRLLELIEHEGDGLLSAETRSRLFAALIRAYALGWHSGAQQPFATGEATTDQVVVTAAEMLRACHVTSFEMAAMFDV